MRSGSTLICTVAAVSFPGVHPLPTTFSVERKLIEILLRCIGHQPRGYQCHRVR